MGLVHPVFNFTSVFLRAALDNPWVLIIDIFSQKCQLSNTRESLSALYICINVFFKSLCCMDLNIQ